MKMINEKPDGYMLSEFVKALKLAYELAVPSSLATG